MSVLPRGGINMKLYDAFETKSGASQSANDLRISGMRATVRKLNPPQAGGRLKWGVYAQGFGF